MIQPILFFRDACPAAVISYGLHEDADVQALDVQTTVEGGTHLT